MRTIFRLLCVCLLAGCSKSELEVATPADSTTPLVQQQQQAANRIVEIDRLLSAPVTGDPADADRRIALRAERAALTGNPNPAVFTNRRVVAATPPATNSVRLPNGDVVNYVGSQPSSASGGIVVAPNSQATSLSFLEQMTPSERERYYRDVRLRNTRTIDIRVRPR
jgi:hypothetical protein